MAGVGEQSQATRTQASVDFEGGEREGRYKGDAQNPTGGGNVMVVVSQKKPLHTNLRY